MVSSCSNIYIIKLHKDEHLVLSKTPESKNSSANTSGSEDVDEEITDGEGHNFDIVQTNGYSNRSSANRYYKYDLMLNAGFTKIYGDLQHTDYEPAFRFSFDRYLNRRVAMGIVFRRGTFSEYEDKNSWTDGLRVNNQFTTVALQTRISPFKVNGNNLVSGIYIGTGIGILFSDISNISTKFHDKDNFLITQVFPSAINTNSAAFYIPFNFGVNIPLSRKVFLNYNYEFSYSFSDDLDGYNFKGGVANKYNDMFSIMSLGIGFRFGK